MLQVAPYVVGGLMAVVAMEYGPAVGRHLGINPSVPNSAAADTPTRSVEAGKGHRSVVATNSAELVEVATVELIGLGDTAIVYRHRDGRELFRTDPLKNVTVVTKGFVLPQVTVRRDSGSPVTPIRMRDLDEQRKQGSERSRPAEPTPPASKPEKMPVGCESSFSPVASPAMAHHLGRCMAEYEGKLKLDALSG